MSYEEYIAKQKKIIDLSNKVIPAFEQKFKPKSKSHPNTNYTDSLKVYEEIRDKAKKRLSISKEEYEKYYDRLFKPKSGFRNEEDEAIETLEGFFKMHKSNPLRESIIELADLV